MVGKSTAGNAATASRRYANAPNTMKVAVISVVSTGRRIQSSEMTMCSGPRFRFARGDAGAVVEQQLALGHDGFAPVETAFENRLPVQHARDLDVLDRRGAVLDDK